MSQLLLLNPSKRGNKMSIRKKTRSPAQKAAARRLVLFNKRRFSKNPAKKASAATLKRRATARSKQRKIDNVIPGYYPNPVKRRKRASTIARNTKITFKNAFDNNIKPAAIQASGALLLDVGYGYFGQYIPESMNNGMLKHATKGFIAIGLGMLANKVTNNKSVNALVNGALTVTMHDALKEAMTEYAPSISMGNIDNIGYINPSPVYSQDEMGAFISENNTSDCVDNQNMGYFVNEQPFDTSSF